MDPKAAAKSKRSHTVHGRRAHQTPAAAAAHKQKRAAAAASSTAPRSRNLPSNWDRYEAEAEAEGGESATAAEWTGEVAPRSKGSDFAFLLEQARAQPREARGLTAPWLPTQGSPFDFMEASTSMLEAKGEGILSWCDDDNFILEDDLAPDFEVPFLSMDLHALANQLSKIKLSQRLFIEEDLLPEDLADASEDNQIMIECGTSVGSDAKGTSVQHNLKNIAHRNDGSNCDNASNICSDGQMKKDHQLQCADQKTTALPKSGTQMVHSDSKEDKRYTRIIDTDPGTGCSEGLKFEVADAEEELDMLLNSFSGTHLSSSNLDESPGHNSILQGMKINESNGKATASMSSKSLVFAPVDESLDDLLSETSRSVQVEGFAASSLTSQPHFNSDDNVDVGYAKQIDVTTSIDDSVDDLLESTSVCLNEQKQTTPAQEQDNSNDIVPPRSGPSNASDDFDSWFDSL
ncbi:hypothetical protein ACP70R_033916 [Stipagrostis hirtigluma subsp. patula]